MDIFRRPSPSRARTRIAKAAGAMLMIALLVAPSVAGTHLVAYHAGIDRSAGMTSEDDGEVVDAPGNPFHGVANRVAEPREDLANGSLFLDGRMATQLGYRHVVQGTDFHARAILGRDVLLPGVLHASAWFGWWTDHDRDGMIRDLHDTRCGDLCAKDEFRWRGTATGEALTVTVYLTPFGAPGTTRDSTRFHTASLVDHTGTNHDEQGWSGAFPFNNIDLGLLRYGYAITVANAPSSPGQIGFDLDHPDALVDVDVYEAIHEDVESLWLSLIGARDAMGTLAWLNDLASNESRTLREEALEIAGGLNDAVTNLTEPLLRELEPVRDDADRLLGAVSDEIVQAAEPYRRSITEAIENRSSPADTVRATSRIAQDAQAPHVFEVGAIAVQFAPWLGPLHEGRERGTSSRQQAIDEAVAAGWAAPQPIPDRNRNAPGSARIVPFATTADDGTRLRGHVHLPVGDGPFPAVLVYSPYWNEGGGADSDDPLTARYVFLREAGYAVALVNIRGTGLSAGCFSYMNVPADGADGAAVIRALAAEPWSDGNVSMFGISYPAAVQYSVLAHGAPPELKAVVPMSGTVDVWNLLGRNGAALRSTGTTHPVQRDLDQGLGLASRTPTPHHACGGSLTGGIAYQELATTGDKTAWFKARDVRQAIDGTTVPALVTSGLTSGEGHIAQLDGLWPLLAGPKQFLLGQWGHAIPPRGDFAAMVLDFLDAHVRGGDAAAATDEVHFQDRSGTWRTTSAWPPPGDELRLRLSDGSGSSHGGRLVEGMGHVSNSRVSIVSDPNQGPGPSRCGANQALYISAPLVEDVVVAGHFVARLTIESTHPAGHVVANLYHTSGAPRCAETGSTQIARAIGTLRHRGGTSPDGIPFPIDKPDVVTLRSEPFAVRVPAGDRIVLAIAGGSSQLVPPADFPVLTLVTGGGAVADLQFNVIEGVFALDA